MSVSVDKQSATNRNKFGLDSCAFPILFAKKPNSIRSRSVGPSFTTTESVSVGDIVGKWSRFFSPLTPSTVFNRFEALSAARSAQVVAARVPWLGTTMAGHGDGATRKTKLKQQIHVSNKVAGKETATANIDLHTLKKVRSFTISLWSLRKHRVTPHRKKTSL